MKQPTGHNMKKHLSITALFLVLLFSLNSCITLAERQKNDYGLLESAVTFSSDKVIGEYGDKIPDDFDSDKFIHIVKDKIPDDYYHALINYQIDVTPKGSYYLLKAYDSKRLILFDYSCSPEVDGPVLLEPGKYDLYHLEIYDICK